MKSSFIVPIDNDEEADFFIRDMICPNCKFTTRKEVYKSKLIEENGYHYNEATITCINCMKQYSVRFFDTNQIDELKELKNYDI